MAPWLGIRVLIAALAFTDAQATAATATAEPGDIGRPRLNELVLDRCADGSGWCGTLGRALDPEGRLPGTVSIGFRWYPPERRAQGGSALPVVTMIDGGPGYGATQSPEDYLALAGPLRRRHAILLVDNRGTGASGALACDLLDGKPGLPASAVAQCGERLGQAAAFYGSAMAADDLAALLDALGIVRTKVYAISYGTYFLQYFAARHPDRVERMVLDSAYPVHGGGPFFSTLIPAVRRAVTDMCARHADRCAPDPTLLDRLVSAARERPAHGRAPDSLGGVRRVTLDPGSLFVALAHASGGLVAYRDFAAAARAYLEDGDATPLLRIVAEGETLHDPSASSRDPRAFSKTLFAAVSCSDYPKLFDMRAPPEERRWMLALALERLGDQADVYRPFTLAELGASAFQENRFDLCVDWPWPANMPPPERPAPPFAPIPTLVMTGQYDPLTTVEEGAAVAAQFPRSTHLVVANEAHAPALVDPDGCAGEAVRRFLAGDHVDAPCASPEGVPPPDRFERRTGGTPADLARIARLVAEDAATRSVFGVPRLAGLRGGAIRYRAMDGSGRVRVRLSAVRWTEDAAVSGSLLFDRRAGTLAGLLRVRHRGRVARVPIGEAGPGDPLAVGARRR